MKTEGNQKFCPFWIMKLLEQFPDKKVVIKGKKKSN